MVRGNTLVDVIQTRSLQPDLGVTFIYGQQEERHLSYRSLYRRSLQVLHVFQARGIKPKQELVFQIENEESFVVTFWACVLGGMIPVPCTVGSNDEHRMKLLKIWSVLHDPVLISEESVWGRFKEHMSEEPVVAEMENAHLSIEDLLCVLEDENAPLGQVHSPDVDDIAFIQFSSGSTGDPKGVVLTHHNVLHNLQAIVSGISLTAADSILSWMPLTHDMGLIGMHLMPTYGGNQHYIITTNLFVRRPMLWLAKVSEHRVSITSSPNFGYKLLLTTFKEKNASDWDLSRVRIIFNGAEPISYDLCLRFLDRMESYGLSRRSMLTVYGMAEATVGATFPLTHEEMIPVHVDRRSLTIGTEVIELTNDERSNPHGVTFLDVGFAINFLSVRICDEQDRILADNRVGYIQIRGESVTKGYYNNSEATAKVITADGWLNTGDLGFLRNERLVITGRAKDIIFVNGQNVYPHDIETVAENVEGIELGKVAATGVFDESLQRDRILVFVQYKRKMDEFAEVAIRAQKYINRKMGLTIDHVLPVRAIPKTTSGKVQRYMLGQMYQQGEFAAAIAELDTHIREAEAAVEIVIPRNEMETEVANVWKSVLGIERISVYDNFFEIGGNSALAMQMVNRLDTLYPGRLEISDSYAVPTIALLAEHLTKTKRSLVVQPLSLPASYFESAEKTSGQMETVGLKIEGEVLEKLQVVAKEANGTLRDLMLAIWMNVLAQLSRSPQVELQVIADMETILHLPLDLAKFEAVDELIAAIQAKTSEPSNYFRLSEIKRTSESRKELAIQPGFFYTQAGARQPDAVQEFDLVLQVEEWEQGIEMLGHFDARRLKKAKVIELLTIFVKMLQSLASNTLTGGGTHAPIV